MTTHLQEKVTTMPNIPKEFGDDGGRFYRYYDELADEIDEDLVKSLKAQLDGILIFAGLFAGVNSAFLALTLPQMSANPADDTNAILLQIALGGNNNITSATDLPSASFTPPPRIYPIIVLFSVSLTLALLSSFLAILGQQWIVYYRKRGGGGPEHQRWEQLRRHLGAKRWRLELVLDDLVPSLLQIGLVIFCIAFALYLGTLSQSLSRIIVSLLCLTAAAILAMSTCAAFDPWCPFKMPLSRILRPVVSAFLAAVTWLGLCSVAGVLFIATRIITATRRAMVLCSLLHTAEWEIWRGIKSDDVGEVVALCATGLTEIYRWLLLAGIRCPEDADDLKIKALKRVMCTSEDRNALIFSAINLQIIRDQDALSSLAEDEEFRTRLFSLHQAALRETQRGRGPTECSLIESRVFSTSFFHLLITTGSVFDISWLTYTMSPSEIVALDNRGISPNEIRDLSRGSTIPFSTSCDECSHCASLRFCIRVVNLVVEGLSLAIPTKLDVAFKDIAGALTTAEDLRLGCVIASAILCSKEWCDAGLWGSRYWPRSKLLEALFQAYRWTSESRMFQTISIALTTVNSHWEGKPDHEIYVRLFELCLLPGRKGVSIDGRHAVLECVDAHLLSIEHRIRDKNTSEEDRKHERDHRNRYLQSVTDFFEDCQDSSREMWSLIGAPMERYLSSIKEFMKADPENSENSGTMAILRRIESSFPEPADNHQQGQDPQSIAYLKFRQLLNQIDLLIQMNVARFSKDRHDDQGYRLPEIRHGLWGN